MMNDEIFNKSPLIKKHFGKCALCGKECELTFEHIPPKSSGNMQSVKPVSLESYLKKGNRTPWDLKGVKYINLQKGMGLYSLCSDCNSFTGAKYGDSYIKDIKALNQIFEEPLPKDTNAIELEIYPLRFFKQICSHFCSINPGLEIASFVLDEESKIFDKSKYRMQMYFTQNRIIRFNSFSAFGNIRTGGIDIISEITAYPVGFQLISNPQKELPYVGFDITSFSDCSYNDKRRVVFPLIIKEVNTIIGNDYRSKEEIIAQIEKSEAFKKENNNGTV